ncbi:MAG: Smr/MutS family protein [Hyphomicrobiales bacterium]|nr:Smr/MutS family protein [Hyphomicrobiales bacterium]
MAHEDNSPPRRGQRQLRPEEIDLWLQVVAKIKRRNGAKLPTALMTLPLAPKPARQPASKPAAPRYVAEPYQAAPPAHQAPRSTHLPTLDAPLRKQLKRGRAEIEGRLDLHGMRQEQAHQSLRHFIIGAQARGARVVMVVTGKGGSMAGDVHERGILRRMTPFWLQAADLRPLIIGIEAAAPHHGGEGALYIHLRRRA